MFFFFSLLLQKSQIVSSRRCAVGWYSKCKSSLSLLLLSKIYNVWALLRFICGHFWFLVPGFFCFLYLDKNRATKREMFRFSRGDKKKKKVLGKGQLKS